MGNDGGVMDLTLTFTSVGAANSGRELLTFGGEVVIRCWVPKAWAHAGVTFLHRACQKEGSTLSSAVLLHSGNVRRSQKSW